MQREGKEHARQDSSSSGYSCPDSEFSIVGLSTLLSRSTIDEEDFDKSQRRSSLHSVEPSRPTASSSSGTVTPLRIQKAAKWLNSQFSASYRSKQASVDSTWSAHNSPRLSKDRAPSVLVPTEPRTPTSPDNECDIEPATLSPTQWSYEDGRASCVEVVRQQSLNLSSNPRVFEVFSDKKALQQMRQRHNCVRELYNTEYLFAQDMAVVVRLYMCASANIGLSMRQIDSLFSNVTQVLDISLSLVAILETNIPTQILRGDGTIGPYDVTADCEVRVGKALCSALNGQLYEVYEDYIHHSKEQLELYFKLTHNLRRHPQKAVESSDAFSEISNVNQKQVKAWLDRCGTRAAQFTTAWSLDSLLIKPVQRLGKYPLFLQTLLNNTDSQHADYADIERALRRSRHYLDCVNARLGHSDR